MGTMTKENVWEVIDKHLKGKELSYDLLEWVLYILDFALSTLDVRFMQDVHLKICSIFLPFFESTHAHDR